MRHFPFFSPDAGVVGCLLVGSRPLKLEHQKRIQREAEEWAARYSIKAITHSNVSDDRMPGDFNLRSDISITREFLEVRRRRVELLGLWAETRSESVSQLEWSLYASADGVLQIAADVQGSMGIEAIMAIRAELVKYLGPLVGFVEVTQSAYSASQFGVGQSDPTMVPDRAEFERRRNFVNQRISRGVVKLPLDEVLWDIGELNFVTPFLLALRVNNQALRDWICEGPSYRGALSATERADSLIWTVDPSNISRVRAELGDLVVCREPTLRASVKGWFKRALG